MTATRHLQEVEQRLRSLPLHEQHVLEVLSAACWAMNRTSLNELLGAARVRQDDGRPYTTTALKPLLRHTSRLHLTGDHGPGCRPGYYRCDDAVAHWTLARAAEQGRLGTLMRAVQSAQPARRHHWAEPDLLLRDARLLLYAGQSQAAERAFADATELARSYYRGRYQATPDVRRLMGAGAPAEALRLLPSLMVAAYCEQTLPAPARGIGRVDDPLWDLLLALPAALRSGSFGSAAAACLLHGEIDRCRQLAAAEPIEIATHTAAALAALATGDFSGARDAALAGVELSRGPKRRRKPRIEGPPGPWVALLLISAEDGDTRAIGLQLLRALEHDSRAASTHALSAFSEFLDQGSSEPVEQRARWNVHGASAEDPIGALFWGLVLHWSGADRQTCGEAAKWLSSARRAAEHRDATWLLTQCAAAETALGGGEPSPKSLTQLYRLRPQWEVTLDAMASVAAGAADKELRKAKSQRLAWFVGLASESDWGVDRAPPLRLECRLQKRTAKGWSQGQAISLRKLQERASSDDGVGEDDRRICAHLGKDPERPYAGNLVFGPTVALDLVGHARVFWAADREPAEVVRDEPRLHIEEAHGQLCVRMVPQVDGPERHLLCEREGNRLLVYALSPQQQRIAGIVGSSLQLPAEARSRLQRTLGELASVVPVRSAVEVEGAQAQPVACDSRPHLQLWRASPGLRLRLSVFPLGLDGPAMPAGEGPATVIARADERQLRTERDLPSERRLLHQLIAACPTLTLAEEAAAELRLSDPLSCYELLTELAALDESNRVIVWPEGQPLSVIAERDVRDLRLRLSERGDWLVADGELQVDEDLTLDLQQLLDGLLRSPGRFIELDGGRLVALSDQLRRRLEELDSLGQRRRKRFELHPMATLMLDGWVSELAELRSDRKTGARLERLRESHALNPQVPSTLQAQLRDYQREGFDWLCRLAHWGGGACLADDMGLGKTVQVLALLLHRAAGGPALVVAPTSVCSGWIGEARRFAPTLNIREYANGDRQRVLSELQPFDLLVCSYGLLTQDAELLAEHRFHTIVLDEAQAIKNATTQRARAAMQLQGDCRIVTTGTPVENHLGEIWSQMSFLNPGLLGSIKQFEQRFARPIQRDDDREASQRLRRLLRPFILRRTKAQVLEELPPKTETILRIEPTSEQASVYEALRRKALQRLENAATGNPQERMRLLGDITRLRRAACHPRLVMPDGTFGSAKLDTLEALVRELCAEGHKALVFSQFVDHLTLARERLDQLGISYQYLDGGTPSAQRTRRIAAFQAGEGDVFLISLRAGGFGLNLTAADYVIHLDPWWNPAVEDQASDRVHRMGQKRPVTVYKLVTSGTIEERVISLHGNKRELAASLLAESDRSGRSLDIDELRDLLCAA